MGKSYEDYDKVTKWDVVKEHLKLFALSIAGGVIGALPYIVLWCFFSIDSLITLLLSGIGAIAFIMEVGKYEKLKWYDHILSILGMIFSVAISDIVVILVHFAPDFTVDGNEKASLIRKLFIILKNSGIDQISSKGLVTDNGAFSVYTEFFFGIFFAIVGFYVTLLILTLTSKNKKKRKKK